MAYQDILFQKEGGLATITLNRPDKLNALSEAMRVDLKMAAAEVLNDDEIRVAIITGAGRGFCSGADVGRQAERLSGEAQPQSRREVIEPVGGWVLPLSRVTKPLIAAVNGMAAGAGLSLAAICDIRIASEEARFCAVWVRRGLVPDAGASYTLPRLIGLPQAMRLCFTGDIIEVREAERIGLVDLVVPGSELMKVTRELAARIAQGPPIAIELTKSILRSGLSLEEQVERESSAQRLCRQTEDHKEGVRSFLEKRPALFRGL